MLDECKKPEIFRRLLFGLAMFHAVSQERRKFGPLGFNNTYEFNDSDLDTSVQMLKMFLDEQEEIPWDSLNFMTGDINYGGRVTDAWDQRCLSETLKRFYCLENLEDGYFYDEENIYFCPPNGPLSVYKNYIESLPGIDSPSIFGLHANANISYQL
jgi:dynein heavy chain